MPKDTTSHSDTSGSQTTTIPRPPNPWILFRRDVCATPAFKALYPKAPQHIVSRAISVIWRNASPEVQARYASLAVLAAKEHEKRYPGYKYRPRKKG
ncbi:high mobility group box domain-containing protein, partial [Lentinula boryana]